jgi:Cys-tRNA(Pro)/Cys-tRNA(Cys) deacylase
VAATPATQFLKSRKIAFDLLEYAHDPRAETYGLEAAEKLHLKPETVFKTLVISDEGTPARHALGLVPAAEKLSLPAAARALGWKRAAMAKPADAQRLTGYVVGGISAFGTKRPLPVLVDATMLEHPLAHLSGGRRGLEIRLAPADLVASLEAVVAEITM